MEDKKAVRKVYKAHDLVEARYRLSTTEQKILILLISKVDPTKPDFENPYLVSFDEVAECLSISKGGSQYALVHGAFERLMSRLLKVYEKGDEGESTENTISWFYRREYVVGETDFKVWFHEYLKKYVLQLSSFLRYGRENVFQLQSSYSIRIYEMLKQWESVGSKKYEVSELKKILGIRDTEYKLYGHFKSRVIKVAKQEIFEQTDIKFEFTEVKKGRKVVALNFEIEKNRPKRSLKKKGRGRPRKKETSDPGLNIFKLIDSPPPDEKLSKRLRKYGILEENIQKYGKKALEYGLHKADKMEGNPLDFGGVIIQSAKNFRLHEDSEKDVEKVKVVKNELVTNNKYWLERKEKETQTKLTRHDKLGVWTKENGVSSFSDPNFIEKTISSFESIET